MTSPADLDDIIARHAGREGALMPILHEVQAAFGCIDEAARRAIALTLNLSRADVQGVVSFYHDFRENPRDRPAIKLCRAEACQARGGEPLAHWAEREAGERVEIETVYCLGLCSVGPNAMVGEEVFARLDEASLGALIEEAAR